MFYALFTQPLLNLLAFFVWLAPHQDLGIGIILVTVLLRVVMYPLQALASRSQRAMARLGPKLETIKKQFPNAKEKQLEATMALYRAEGVNPLAMAGSTVLLMAVQLPILFALFSLFSGDITANIAQGLYSFIPRAERVSTSFFGMLELTKPSVLLAVLAAAAQFLQMRLAAPKTAPAKEQGMFMLAMQKQMQYVFPVLTVFIAMRLPAALGLYWTAFTLLGVLDDLWRLKRQNSSLVS